MSLRLIKAFVTVAEEGNFTKAARRLFIAQPALSRQVRQLENDLSVTLFVKRGRSIGLTSEGRMLLDKARSVTAAETSLRRAAQTPVREHAPSSLHVGLARGLWTVLARIKADYRNRVPTGHVTVSRLVSSDALDGPLEHDVLIVRAPVDPVRYESATLFREQLVAVVDASHVLASRQTLRLADVVPGLALTAEQSATSVTPAVSGPGVCLGTASRFTDPYRARGMKVVPIDESSVAAEVRIAWTRHPSSRFVNEFVRSARSLFH
jgi:DNA-binding transcriptional LysR family regulator